MLQPHRADTNASVVMGICERVGWTSRGQRTACDLDELEQHGGAMLATEHARRRAARIADADVDAFDGRLFDIAALRAA